MTNTKNEAKKSDNFQVNSMKLPKFINTIFNADCAHL